MTERSPRRRHDRELFYKYMKFDTAKIVLTTRRVRWKTPLEFNDMFDVPREIDLGFTPEQARDALTERFVRLIEQPDLIDPSWNPRLKLMLDMVKKGTSEKRKSLVEHLRRAVPEMGQEMLDRMRTGLEEVKVFWRNRLPELRVFCLSETNSNEVMWTHYAENNRGAVLEFRCIDELDSYFLLAEKVEYLDSLPPIATAVNAAECFVSGRKLFEPKELYDKYLHTKKAKWEYEQEWRIFTFADDDDTGSYTDMKFNPQELAAIYVGAAMSAQNVEEVKRLLVGDFAHVRLHKCVPDYEGRQLKFEPVV